MGTSLAQADHWAPQRVIDSHSAMHGVCAQGASTVNSRGQSMPIDSTVDPRVELPHDCSAKNFESPYEPGEQPHELPSAPYRPD